MICVSEFMRERHDIGERASEIRQDSAFVVQREILVVCAADFSGANFSVNPLFFKCIAREVSHLFRERIVAFDDIFFCLVESPFFRKKAFFAFGSRTDRREQIVERKPLVFFSSGSFGSSHSVLAQILGLFLEIFSPFRKRIFDCAHKCRE